MITKIARALLFVGTMAACRGESTISVPTAGDSDVSIRITTPLAANPLFGFMPVKVAIDNGSTRDGTWRFNFVSGNPNSPPGELTSSTEFSVAARIRREFWFFVPISSAGYNAGPTPAPPGPPDLVTMLEKARQDLLRLGYLRVPPATRVTGTAADGTGVSTFTMAPNGRMNRSTNRRGPAPPIGSAVTITFVEEGPPTALPAPEKSTLPPNTTATVAMGSPTGLATRTFVTGTTIPAAPAPTALLAQPLGGGMPLSVTASGPGISGASRQGFVGMAGGPLGMPPIAVAASLDLVLRTKITAAGIGGTLPIAAVDLGTLPADWRAWSSFHAVVLPESDYAVLDTGRRSALNAWLTFGGEVYLFPDASKPGSPVSRVEHVGAGRITTLEIALADLPAADVGWNIGLGSPAASLPRQEALKSFSAPSRFDDLIAEPDLNPRWIAGFIASFAVLIGPVNLFVFAPARRRYRLFITTPAIALGGALVLAVAIALQDGFGGTGARDTIVALIPGENSAAVTQVQVARTGFVASQGFDLEDDILVSGVSAFAPRPSRVTLAYGRAEGDWFRSRFQQAMHLRRVLPTRGRVERVGVTPDGKPIVASTLATTLVDFVYRDPAGRLWNAREVATGRRVVLEPGGEWGAAWAETRFKGSEYLSATFAAMTTNARGHWIALGGDTEVAPIPTLKSIEWDSRIAYTGEAAEPGRGPARTTP